MRTLILLVLLSEFGVAAQEKAPKPSPPGPDVAALKAMAARIAPTPRNVDTLRDAVPDLDHKLLTLEATGDYAGAESCT